MRVFADAPLITMVDEPPLKVQPEEAALHTVAVAVDVVVIVDVPRVTALVALPLRTNVKTDIA